MDLTYRTSKAGIDTLLLAEAIDIEKQSFRLAFFDPFYNLVAQRFDQSFTNVDFHLLPFSKDKRSHASFLAQLWKDYFICEIDSIIAAEPSFAIRVIEMVVNADLGWENGSIIARIVTERYSSDSTKPDPIDNLGDETVITA
jgi:hypothetical protein